MRKEEFDMKKLGIILSASVACVCTLFITYKIGKNNGEAKAYREAAEELDRIQMEFIKEFGNDSDEENGAQ